jgi:ABC-type transport system involved in multi-copper enzyme maturation permease subunit
MFLRLLLLEKDKLAGRLVLWIELGILALAIILVDVTEYLISINTSGAAQAVLHQMLEWPHSAINAVNFSEVHELGGILLVIIIAVVTAREYSWRTFHLWLSRGVSRLSLMAAKSIVIIALTLALVLTSLIIGLIVTGLLTLLLHGSLQLSQDNVQQLVLNFLITDLGLLPYAALTFMLTILFRNSAASMGIVLVLLLLVENALYIAAITLGNATTSQIAQYLPVGLDSSLQNAVFNIQSSSPATASIHYATPLVACICLFAYTIIFAAIGIWRFTRQNFTD